MPASFRYDPVHSTDQPPLRVVRGVVTGSPGKYKLIFVLSTSGLPFTEEISVVIDDEGRARVDADILECKATPHPGGLLQARLRYVLSQANRSRQGSPRDVNYRCS